MGNGGSGPGTGPVEDFIAGSANLTSSMVEYDETELLSKMFSKESNQFTNNRSGAYQYTEQ